MAETPDFTRIADNEHVVVEGWRHEDSRAVNVRSKRGRHVTYISSMGFPLGSPSKDEDAFRACVRLLVPAELRDPVMEWLDAIE